MPAAVVISGVMAISTRELVSVPMQGHELDAPVQHTRFARREITLHAGLMRMPGRSGTMVSASERPMTSGGAGQVIWIRIARPNP